MTIGYGYDPEQKRKAALNIVKSGVSAINPVVGSIIPTNPSPGEPVTARQVMNENTWRDWDRRLQEQQKERDTAQSAAEKAGVVVRQGVGNAFKATIATPMELAMNNIVAPALDTVSDFGRGVMGLQQPAPPAVQTVTQTTTANQNNPIARNNEGQAANPARIVTTPAQTPISNRSAVSASGVVDNGWIKSPSGITSRQARDSGSGQVGTEYQMRLPDGGTAWGFKASGQRTPSPVQQQSGLGLGYQPGGVVSRGGYSFQGPPADAARFYEPIITGPNANNLSGPTNETFRRYRAAELAEQNGPHFVTPREYGWGWKGHNERVASQIQNGLEQARLAQSQQSLDMQDLSSQYKHQIDQARLANEQAQLQQQLAQGGLAYAQGMNQFGYNRQLQQMRQQLSQLDPNSQAARDLQWRINALGGDNTQPERKYIPRTSEDALGNKTTEFYTPNQDGSLSRVQILDEQNDGGVKSTEQFERQKKEVMSKLGNKEQQAALESALQSARTLEQRQAIINSFLEKLK